MIFDSTGKMVGEGDERFRTDAMALSKFVTIAISKVQAARPPQMFDGIVTTHCILAGIAFSVGNLIHRLPPRERKKLREYLVQKLDDMLREHGA